MRKSIWPSNYFINLSNVRKLSQLTYMYVGWMCVLYLDGGMVPRSSNQIPKNWIIERVFNEAQQHFYKWQKKVFFFLILSGYLLLLQNNAAWYYVFQLEPRHLPIEPANTFRKGVFFLGGNWLGRGEGDRGVAERERRLMKRAVLWSKTGRGVRQTCLHGCVLHGYTGFSQPIKIYRNSFKENGNSSR